MPNTRDNQQKIDDAFQTLYYLAGKHDSSSLYDQLDRLKGDIIYLGEYVDPDAEEDDFCEACGRDINDLHTAECPIALEQDGFDADGNPLPE